MNKLLLQSILVIIGFAVMQPAMALEVPEARDAANAIVEEEIVPSLDIHAVQDDTVISAKDSTGAIIIKTIHYIGLDASLELATTELRFSGEAEPASDVTISFPDDSVMETTVTGIDGMWEVVVPTSALSSQQQMAYVQTSYEGVESDLHPIAELVVNSDEALSTTTWVYLFSTMLVIFFLLLVITLQLHRHLKAMENNSLQDAKL